jgi:uncharacterized protein YdaU (DUF1376 family)
MTRLPYMQFWVGDFLASTAHLSLEQKGGYVLVILSMWNSGGSLPNDPAKLARICGISLKRWQHISPEILEFFDHDGDRLTQKRLAAEYQKGLDIIQKRSAAGKKGNSAKSLKSHDAASANANANSERSERISESPSSSESTSEREEGKDIPSLPMDLSGIEPKKAGGAQRTSKVKLSKEVLEPEFQIFMRQYPRPDDEDEARRAYFSTRRSGRATAPELLNGACRYAAEKIGVDPQFIKAPQNWLKHGSWKNPSRAPHTGAGNHQDQQLAQVAGFLPRRSA